MLWVTAVKDAVMNGFLEVGKDNLAFAQNASPHTGIRQNENVN